MKIISTKNAPAAVGPYSQGVVVNGTLYVSGQIPFVPESMTLVGPTIEEQTLQSLTNVLAIVKEAGFELTDIAKCGVFMQDLGMFTAMNKVYEEFFKGHKPARFAVEVRRLPKDVLVEIDAIVAK
ncbi:MAG: RidA family protein [Bacilli bacterium]|nr:RidA family protein [Bacilli bacterium]